MFKNFFIMALTSICGSTGVLPFTPSIIPQQNDNTIYYCNTYSGTGTADESFSQTITYDSYEMTSAQLDMLCPSYTSAYSTNGCAPTAGSIVIAYYDLTYTNLLPDYDPTFTLGGRTRWQPQDSTINALQQTLHSLMGTNTVAPGTSTSQFKTGMTSYFNTQGYSISYNNVTNALSPTNVISYLEQDKPIVLFITSYDYFSESAVGITDTEMTMTGRRNSVGHTVVVCGYIQFKFYEEGTLFRTDDYAYVCFGDSSRGYLSLNDTSYIQEAYTFNIT